ncbi:hypothetical protein ACTGJ9_012225 [Bradyrhizobium sp. RDM12]
MPLMKYFVFVGSALVLLLIGIAWFFQQPAPEPSRSEVEQPTIRISSAEQLPERVVIDTSLPTIVPPSVIFDASTTAVEPAQQRSQVAFAEFNADPKPAASNADADIRKHVARREPAKKVVAHRAAAPLNIAPAPAYIVQEPSTRMSLLETLKERLGQTLFKLN